jgi:hypothetical protein
MGCNCGGSSQVPRHGQQAPIHRPHEARLPDKRSATPPPRRFGGPGAPGYTWDGPEVFDGPGDPVTAADRPEGDQA